MKTGFCEQEQKVLDALRSGKWASPWGEELRQHAAGCCACAEVVFVAEALRREEELALADVRLPSAGLVWWKAQRAARHAAAERAAQPIALVERVAQVFGGLTALGFALLYWPRLLGPFGRWGWFGKSASLRRVSRISAAPWTRHLTLLPPHMHFPMVLLAASAGAFITLMAFAAYAVWREE